MDLAKIIGGSCTLAHRGLQLETASGNVTDLTLETFSVPIDGISEDADQRTKNSGFKISFTPSGKWINPDRLFPHLAYPLGRDVIPVLPITTVALHGSGTPDILQVTNHLLYDGDRVMFGLGNDGVFPTASTPLDADTHYYVKTVDADHLKLFLTAADALAGSNALQFTAAGSGRRVLVGQFPLIVYGEDGEILQFEAAAITSMPDLDMQSEKTPFGKVEFTAFLRNRFRVSDANSFYTASSGAFPGWTANASDIKTQSQTVSWADQLAFASTQIAIDTNLVTINDHGMATQQRVYIDTVGLLPAANPALNPETPLYVNAVSDSTFTLHLSAAAAAAGTGAIDFTSQGTGVHVLTIDNPPMTLLETKMGCQVKFNSKLDPRTNDKDKVYNARVTGVSATATLLAQNLDQGDLLNAMQMQGAGAAPGRSLNAGSRQLNIWSSGMFVRIYGAAITKSSIVNNMKDDRAGEITFVNTRVVQAGQLQPVAVVGTQPPID